VEKIFTMRRMGRWLTVAVLAIVMLAQGVGPSVAEDLSGLYRDINTRGSSEEAIVNRAAEMLLSIAATERIFHEHPRAYATFEQLQERGFLPANATPEKILEGYLLYWYLDNDNSEYSVIAVSKDEHLISFMIDNNGVLLALTPAAPIDIHVSDHCRPQMGKDPKTFILPNITVNLRPYGFVYMSITGCWSAAETYDPSEGYTVEKWKAITRTRQQRREDNYRLWEIWGYQQLYQGFSDEGRYGTLKQLQDAQDIDPNGNVDTLMDDYKLIWCLNEDGSDFTIVAMPKMHEDPIYMVTALESYMELVPVPWSRGYFQSRWNLSNVIDGEEVFMTPSGKYDWVVHKDTTRELKLFLDDDQNTFVLLMLSRAHGQDRVVRNDKTDVYLTEFVYISLTDTVYAIRPIS
jgi:hypothetical protein